MKSVVCVSGGVCVQTTIAGCFSFAGKEPTKQMAGWRHHLRHFAWGPAESRFRVDYAWPEWIRERSGVAYVAKWGCEFEIRPESPAFDTHELRKLVELLLTYGLPRNMDLVDIPRPVVMQVVYAMLRPCSDYAEVRTFIRHFAEELSDRSQIHAVTGRGDVL
ncbi:hypothetical protein GNI_152910 [Gregarina niphandrodes]|uniref:Uncharacterized protein n=1 Tax=Gregarina niphandrodes TaxID=110365 RepID=A0A023B0B8_GRENI|nr:hypothetical protein GNI_152910 [Gregarina niphandrodes]EZG44071.1 hypothetical protein GNI_152910 [Gregarina niphandrodes]|eukprot:XP_011132828.1 hypothetical protein GNI_152910 [Gregarina niphandrodes]